MYFKERFTVGSPVMCWNGDNMEDAKMRTFIMTTPDGKSSVGYPGYDSSGHIEYVDHLCGLDEYRRYITTPSHIWRDRPLQDTTVIEALLSEPKRVSPAQADRVQNHI